MADREITWSLATQYKNGAYQGTFRFDQIQAALDHMSLYFRVRFRRVTRGGQFLVLQSSTQYKNDRNFAAWTLGSTIYISPVYDFKRLATWTAKVFLHEFGHLWGGGSHSNDPTALMNLNTGTSYGWVADDMRWFQRYGLRAGLPPRGSIFEAFRSVDNLPPRLMSSVEDSAASCLCRHGMFARLQNYWHQYTARYEVKQ